MIVLLGGNGFVGTEFSKQLEARQIEFKVLSRQNLNYYDPRILADSLRALRADFLINCAGYTGKPNVDACELERVDCLLGNAVLPGVIRQACDSTHVPWGHVSSGCIFTGSRPDGHGFNELDAPNFCFRTNNCSFYSGTKALGEELLADAENCFVWRLRIPFNEQDNPRNYLTKLMRYSKLLDARNSLSHLTEFVSACIECWLRRVPFGTYNVTNPGSVTAREITELIRQSIPECREKVFQFFSSEQEFMREAAKTPRSNCVLDSTKLLATGIHLSDVHEVLSQSLRNWES